MHVAKGEPLTRALGEYNGIVPAGADPEKTRTKQISAAALLLPRNRKRLPSSEKFP
jgi:hypothetical protein